MYSLSWHFLSLFECFGSKQYFLFFFAADGYKDVYSVIGVFLLYYILLFSAFYLFIPLKRGGFLVGPLIH